MIRKPGHLAAVLVLLGTLGGSQVSADLKRVAYPEVKVRVAAAFAPDAAFQRMQRALMDAVTRKDQAALQVLVGPSFVWMKGGGLSEHADLGRDALHNFRVLFGFRSAASDSPADGGPFWDSLMQFANDTAYYRIADDANLVCGPLSAEIVDDAVFAIAAKRIAGEDADWVFAAAETTVTRGTNDTSVVGRFREAAVPVIGTFPAARENEDVTPTHYEVLLPSGRSGWIKASSVHPLVSSRLCYALTAQGEWKIVLFDEAE